MDFWLHILNMALIVSVLGFSLNLLIGFGGLVSMMHAAIYGIGGYAAAVGAGTLGLPFPLTVGFAVVLAGAFSLLTAWPALRVRGEYLILLTLAIQSVASGLFVAWVSVTGGSSGLGGFGRPVIFGSRFVDPVQWLPLVLAVFVVGYGTAYWVGHSPFGQVLKAIREDEEATLSLGKSVTYHKVVVFGISGALAGLAGGIFAHYQAFISPTSFSLDASIFLIAVVVLGGAGNLLGTFVGAFVLTTLPEALRLLELGSQLVGVAQKFLYGSLLVAFMVYRPKGLIPEGVTLSGMLRRAGRWTKNSKKEREPRETRPVRTGEPATPRPEEDEVTDGPTTGRVEQASLHAQDLHKRFGGVKPADGITLTLPSGIVTALVGPNGAGKTTLFNLLTGFIVPDRGSVRIEDRSLDDMAPWQRVRAGLVRSWQDVRLFQDLTILENVLLAIPEQEGETLTSLFGRPHLVRRSRGAYRERALEQLEFVGMEDQADELVSSLSYGEQKLVSMARLSATGADILLLDEPAAGVDRQWVDRILELIMGLAEGGCTICIVEHNLDVVRAVAANAYFMDAGRIVAEGSPEELVRDPELADLYFGKAAV